VPGLLQIVAAEVVAAAAQRARRIADDSSSNSEHLVPKTRAGPSPRAIERMQRRAANQSKKRHGSRSPSNKTSPNASTSDGLEAMAIGSWHREAAAVTATPNGHEDQWGSQSDESPNAHASGDNAPPSTVGGRRHKGKSESKRAVSASRREGKRRVRGSGDSHRESKVSIRDRRRNPRLKLNGTDDSHSRTDQGWSSDHDATWNKHARDSAHSETEPSTSETATVATDTDSHVGGQDVSDDVVVYEQPASPEDVVIGEYLQSNAGAGQHWYVNAEPLHLAFAAIVCVATSTCFRTCFNGVVCSEFVQV